MPIDVRGYYEKYAPMVLRRCRFLLRNEEEALDIMQDVFVRLLKSESQLKHQAPSSLLYTMATNLCLNRLRRKKLEPLGVENDFLENQEGVHQHERLILTQLILDRIFAREKESTRLIAVYHYVDGMTLEETARVAGMSVSGIRKRLAALKSKAKWLKEGENA